MVLSVCIATYNGEKYIKNQLDSILNQTFIENWNVDLEIIVSDDESTDKTLDIISSYNDNRIKIFHHSSKTNHKYEKGYFACTENFANAISKASGDYIFLSDQDDVWYPWKLDKSLTALKKYGGVVGAAFDIGDVNLNKIGLVIYKKQPFFALKYNHSLYGFSCGFSREEMKYIMPIPNVPQHDTFIMLTALWRNRMNFIDDICAIHRWSGEHNVSSGNNAPKIIKLWYRMKMWIIVIWRAIMMK